MVCDSPDLPKAILDGLVSGQENLHDYLRRIITAITPPKEHLTDDADLSELGLESLEVIALSKQINAYLKRYMPNTQHVSAEIMYAHSRLVENTLSNLDRSSVLTSDADKMQDVVEESLKNLPSVRIHSTGAPSQSFFVLLTGSTGSLGSYILSSLASNSAVETIFCLNRGQDAQRRQMRSLKREGSGL